MVQTETEAALRQIPLIDAREGGVIQVARDHSEGAQRLIEAGKKKLSAPGVALLDARSRKWAMRSGNPYLDEIQAMAATLPTGVWFMNFCYEWGCTTGVAEGGVEMRRTLDWPFHGLGRELMVLQQSGTAGIYYNIAWPGFAGVITGMAPGRFAIAVNQAPLRSHGPWPYLVDWMIDRVRVASSAALPPAHMVRRVLEECWDFESAVAALMAAPLALPALISIAGTKPREGCIVEHFGDRAIRHDAPDAVANDWLSPDVKGRPRADDNREPPSPPSTG